MRKIKTISIVIAVFSLLFSVSSLAKINFEATVQDKIDLETFDIDKQQFFGFLKSSIMEREPGLGNYGIVAFSPCDMKVGDLKIIDHKTPEGKEVKYLSNPSCDQIVIRKVLENSYKYNKSAINSYQNRQCILSVERILSPMLEYYTIKYEERSKGNCNACEFKEKERLDSILSAQKKVLQHCSQESDKVMNFISELDSQIESTYKTKTSR